MSRLIALAYCGLVFVAGIAVACAGSAESSGGPVDAGGATDAGTPVDAGPALDSGAALDEGPDGTAFSCVSLTAQPTFCDDFDEGDASLTPWNVSVVYVFGSPTDGGPVTEPSPNAGSVTIDTATSLSPPGSLREVAKALASDAGTNNAGLWKPLNVSGTEATLDFDFRSSSNGAAFASLDFYHPGITVPDELSLSLDGLSLFQYIPDPAHPNTASLEAKSFDGNAPSDDKWHHVALDAVIGPPATVSLSIDGKPLITHAPLDARFQNGDVQVEVQVSATDTAEELHVDNLVVNVTP